MSAEMPFDELNKCAISETEGSGSREWGIKKKKSYFKFGLCYCSPPFPTPYSPLPYSLLMNTRMETPRWLTKQKR
jgi:hypothetical protein